MGGLQQVEEVLQEGAFARAVFADEQTVFSARNFDTDIVEPAGAIRIGVGHVIQGKDGRAASGGLGIGGGERGGRWQLGKGRLTLLQRQGQGAVLGPESLRP